MAVRNRDHHVPFRSEESIARDAAHYRQLIPSVSPYFDIVQFVESVLPGLLPGGLRIVFYDAEEEDDLVFVTFKPRTLNIDREVWRLAILGEPQARFVLGHEAGHLLLHSASAKAFSTDKEERLKFDRKEFSAEWQADTFAENLFVPLELVSAVADAPALARICGVTEAQARGRLSAVRPRSRDELSGELCPGCGNFTLVRNGVQQDAADAAAKRLSSEVGLEKKWT